MALTDAMLNAAVDAVTDQITAVSLHSSNPSTTGANELTGGTPAYARATPEFAAAIGGGAVTAEALTFDVPSEPSYVGLWAGAAFAGSKVLPDLGITGQDVVIIDVLTVEATAT